MVARALGVGGAATPADYAAGFVGGLVCCVTAVLAVVLIISVASGTPFKTLLLDGLPLRVAVWVGSLTLGVLIAVAAQGHAAALAAAMLPVAILHLGYAGVLRQRRERTQSDALYDAANRIHATVEADAVCAELLDSAQQLLFAGSARIVALDAPPARDGIRVGLDETTALEVSERATGGQWSNGDEKRLQALAAVASGALANALLFEQMQAITRSLGEGVVALDESGIVTFANPAAESLLGWGRGELVGREIAESVDPESRVVGGGNAEWVHLPRLRAGETLRIDEHVVTRRDGAPLDVALTASPVLRDGVVVGAVVVLRDVRDRKALERRLVHQAFHDPLTGLPNRALFLDRLEHARARSLRDGGTQAVLFLDLDRFKVINDSLGHRTGDQVLQTVASRLVGVLRPSDTVARFGGDEFTVLLEQVNDASEAAQTAERILRALQLPMEAGDRAVVVTASIGIAIAEPGNAPGDLLAAADIAMYQAKSRGKNRYVVARPTPTSARSPGSTSRWSCAGAIDDGELEVHYQPVVEAKNGQLYGLEALVRWRHPTLGLLGPGHFMDVAEDTGLVLPLGHWVLEQACIAAVEWQLRHPDSPVVMAVNLSARQFQQPDLCEQVAQVLRSTGPRPEPARPRDHRDGGHGGHDGDPADAAQAQGAEGAAVDRRLRHRVLVAELPQALPGRRRQDRQVLHRRPRVRSRGPRDRPGRHPAGHRGRHADDRGGRGDHRAERAAATARLHDAAGLPAVAARPARRGRAPRRRRCDREGAGAAQLERRDGAADLSYLPTTTQDGVPIRYCRRPRRRTAAARRRAAPAEPRRRATGWARSPCP